MADSDKLSFDPAVVKEKMTAIEGKFAEFAKVLQEINNTMEMNVNKNENSAVFGKCGAAELSAWSDNASTFGDFYNNFNNWSALVSAVSANNIALQNDVISKYRSTGDKLDGVAEARAASSADGLSEDAKKVYDHLIPDSYVPTNEEYNQAKKQGDIPDDWTYEDYKKYMETGESPEGKTPIASSDGAPTNKEYMQAKKQGDIPDDWTYEDYKKYMETGESPEGKTPIASSETEPTQATDSNSDTETTSTTETTEETEPEGEVNSDNSDNSTDSASDEPVETASVNYETPGNQTQFSETVNSGKPFKITGNREFTYDRPGYGQNNYKAEGEDRYFNPFTEDGKVYYYETDALGNKKEGAQAMEASRLGNGNLDAIFTNNSQFGGNAWD